MSRGKYILELTRAQRNALLHVITYAITGPAPLEVYVDIENDTRSEVRPGELLELLLEAKESTDAW